MTEQTLDPEDWRALRALGHRMLDDMFDHLETTRDQPVWRRLPDGLRARLQSPLPRAEGDAASAYADFRELVQPYATGNIHPRFMGWVHGGGNVVGMLAEMLAAGINANLGGRDHAPVEVERQVVRWSAEMLGMPPETSGLLVTGSSMANLIGVLVARTAALGVDVRRHGLGGARLVAYASTAVHGCVARAMDIAGLGTAALRLIAVDGRHRMRTDALEAAIAQDRAEGRQSFLVVGTVGSVDVGAIDDLDAVAEICRREGLWLHVDAAFGALAALSPALRPRLRGIERADSLAFDFHKWAQVPYDAGCILVRDPERHMAAFAQDLAYLRRELRGLAGGHPWPCDLGPDLSRGFRALKVWMTLKTFGADRLGEVVAHCCDIAAHLAARVEREQTLQLLAPVSLNIVCFRFLVPGASDADLDRLNAEIVADLQEAGIAAPSTTRIGGVLAIRAAIVNHRTRFEDVDALVEGVLRVGRARAGAPQAAAAAVCGTR